MVNIYIGKELLVYNSDLLRLARNLANHFAFDAEVSRTGIHHRPVLLGK